MPFILALDQGTTSSRALLFDSQARVAGFAQRELPQIYPKPGWVEHDPQAIWSTQFASAQEALQAAGVQAREVAAIGITNQRETALLWDRRTSVPVANAIVWQDRRTAPLCERLREADLGRRVAARTGLLLDPYFSATKIAWLLQHVDGLRDRAQRGEIAFGTVDTWLIWKLTGGAAHVTDATNASRTMLFDIHRRCWDEELCAALEIPPAILPDVLPSVAPFGETLPEFFGERIPICGVAGDQQAALAGQGGFAAGAAKNTYGTGSFAMLNTGDRVVQSSRGLLSTMACSLQPQEPRYALEGSVFVTGAAVQWLRDGLRAIARADQADALAASVPDTGGVFFIPAFTGLGAPYWDPYARGTIVGITRGTTVAHIARAALESIAYQSAQVLDAMQQDAGIALSELRVDGGGSRSTIAMQLQADLLGVPVIRPGIDETTALGAAYLAGLQSEFWPNVNALPRHRNEDVRFEPQLEPKRRDAALAEWSRAVERSRGWAQPASEP